MTTKHITSGMSPTGMARTAHLAQVAAVAFQSYPDLRDSRPTHAHDIPNRSPWNREEPLWCSHEPNEIVQSDLISWQHTIGPVSATHQGRPIAPPKPRIMTTRQRALLLASRATDEAKLIHALEAGGLRETADQIRYLSRLHETDPEEVPIPLPSLRFCTVFVLTHDELPAPQIGLYCDGLLSAEWSSSEHGTVALIFRVDGEVRFAAAATRHEPVRSVGGLLPPDAAVNAVRSFIPPLEGD